MNHKRKRPKNRRAGCLLCKPYKANGAKGRTESQTLQERKARQKEAFERAERRRWDRTDATA
jgi:hypothetical protein